MAPQDGALALVCGLLLSSDDLQADFLPRWGFDLKTSERCA